jgi:hypothetical protein
LRSARCFEVKQFGATLRTPLGYELIPKLFVLFLFFGADEGATGAEAVGEGIEAHGGLSLWRGGTGRMPRILAVGFMLLVGN